jgi:pimeloyl-ACP methyl ester carboxylesterase
MTASLFVPPVLTPVTWQWQGHTITYTVAGEGPPLVLVHGFGASLGHWRKNIPALAAEGYRVFALDLLGFGASAKPPLDYSLELWQQLLQDFWQTFIGEPTVFVGNSIGALLSLIMAVEHPDLSRGAVLLNCAGGLNHRPEELPLPLRWLMGTFSRVVNTPGVGQFLFNQVRRPSQIRRTLHQVYRNHEAITEELVDLLYQPSCDPTAHSVFAAILRAPAGPSPQQLLPHLKRPLLVLWGEDDPWTPLAGGRLFEQYAGPAPVQFQGIAQTGHCPHDERPEVVNALVLNWLSTLAV